MSFFDDMLAPAREAHDAVFESAIQVTLPGESPTSGRAVLFKATTEEREDQSGRKQRVKVRRARLIEPTTIRHDATITDPDGIVWAIDGTGKRTASGMRLMLRHVVTHEVARRNYRGKP